MSSRIYSESNLSGGIAEVIAFNSRLPAQLPNRPHDTSVQEIFDCFTKNFSGNLRQ